MAQTTDTPAETLEAATQQNVLPPRGLTLLGTFLRPEGPTALLRVRPGDIREVTPGDQVGTATVTAIEHGAIMLAQNGNSRRLSMPEG